MTILQRLRRLFSHVVETDRQERLDNMRELADFYDAKARDARAEVNKIMSEPVIARMREAGL